jgi:hypothetical protein
MCAVRLHLNDDLSSLVSENLVDEFHAVLGLSLPLRFYSAVNLEMNFTFKFLHRLYVVECRLCLYSGSSRLENSPYPGLS